MPFSDLLTLATTPNKLGRLILEFFKAFAERFYRTLHERSFKVAEVKAPYGRVRWDETGKILIQLPDQDHWLPSNRQLNYYAGAGKHN